MSERREKPAILVVFYANPDRYPPTRNAVVLLRERFRVHLVCRNSAEPPGVSWPDDVRIERVGPPATDAQRQASSRAAKLGEYLGFVRAVHRAARASRPRVVLAYEPYALVASALAAARLPVIYQRHEVEDLDRIDVRSLGGWVLRASLPLGRRAALVVFPEKNRAAHYMRAARDPRQALIVPNFPLRATFPPIASWSEAVDARWADKVVLYRGAVGASNGLREAVAAMAHLAPELRLRLFGAADPAFVREILSLAASLGVADRVRYEGFLPSFEALNRETARAAVGVVLYQPVDTNWQFVGSATNKLYEYAACGVPAVVPDRPAFREFLGGERWVEYADPSDPASVAAAVLRLLDDRGAYEERCRAARRAFEERLNYDVVFEPLKAEALRLSGV